MDFLHRAAETILEAEIDFQSPFDEDLARRMVQASFQALQMTFGTDTKLLEASFNGAPSDDPLSSDVAIDNLLSGSFVRDDQWNELFLEVLTGAGADADPSASYFPILDSVESTQVFVVGENANGETLFDAGVLNNDTFRIVGHIHDGNYGEKIFASAIIGGLDVTMGGESLKITGASVAPFQQNIPHGLGKVPKFMWGRYVFSTSTNLSISSLFFVNIATNETERQDERWSDANQRTYSGFQIDQVPNSTRTFARRDLGSPTFWTVDAADSTFVTIGNLFGPTTGEEHDFHLLFL